MRFSTPQSCGGFRWPNITKSLISAGDGTDVEQQLGRESEAQWGIKGLGCMGDRGGDLVWFCASTYGFIMASLWVLHNVWTSVVLRKTMGMVLLQEHERQMQRFREERERAAHALEEERQKRLRLLQEKTLVGKRWDSLRNSPIMGRFIGCNI